MLTLQPPIAPDFGRRTGRARVRAPGWKAAGLLALACSGVAMAALPRFGQPRDAEQAQWHALAIAPMSEGAGTGLRMAPGDAVEPIDVAPERSRIHFAATLGERETVHSLLQRAGATYGDAAAAAALIARAAPSLAAGASIAVDLGAKNGTARPIERVELKSGLGRTLVIARSPTGLRLHQLQAPVDTTPLRIQGRAGDGLYWALRTAGASPQAAAQYLAALATTIDVGGDVGPDDRFDLIVASRRAGSAEREEGPVLYAGLDRAAGTDLQIIRWTTNGRSEWIDAANAQRPTPLIVSGAAWPVSAPITSYFGYRRHPILRFSRLHAGLDFGANWGSPIVATADGQVVHAGWAGGYGRQVRLAHGGGLTTSYSHMSSIVAQPGTLVRRGQLIGYVGSSGLSTGPHLHYEVRRDGAPVNPLSVRFSSVQMVDNGMANAVKARLKALLSVGTKRGSAA